MSFFPREQIIACVILTAFMACSVVYGVIALGQPGNNPFVLVYPSFGFCVAAHHLFRTYLFVHLFHPTHQYQSVDDEPESGKSLK